MNNMPAIDKRRATSADEEFMRRLHKAANQDVIVRQFGAWDDEIQARLFSQRWVPEAFELLQVDGRPIGCIRIEDHPDHVLLADIQLLPEFQGRYHWEVAFAPGFQFAADGSLILDE